MTVIWEGVEWTTDHLGFTGARAGLCDTMLDVAMGGAGATMPILLLWRSKVMYLGLIIRYSDHK